MSGIWALVPVKSLGKSKSRLAPALSPLERQLLSAAMLRDVLGAITSTAGLDGCLVITADPTVDAIATEAGVDRLRELDPDGDLNRALCQGLERLGQLAAGGALIVPADVPLTTSAELGAVLAASPEAPSVTICSSADGDGTNALLLRPPDVLHLSFGAGSYQAHLAQARARGVEVVELHLPGIALDLDEPRDLEELLSWAASGATFSVLEEHGLGAQFNASMLQGSGGLARQ